MNAAVAQHLRNQSFQNQKKSGKISTTSNLNDTKSATSSKKRTRFNSFDSNYSRKVIIQSNTLKMTNPEQYTAIDCIDKECSLSHIILANCIVYLHTNNSNCNIPCKLDGCEIEIHHYINCPIWSCALYTTTTSTTSTTTTTTTDTTSMTTDTTMTTPSTTESTTTFPEPTPSPVCPTYKVESIFLYISIFLNILLMIAIILLCLYIKTKIRRSRNTHHSRTRRVSLLDNNDHYFSIGSDDSNATNSENLPLLQTIRPNAIPNYRTSSRAMNMAARFENVDLNSSNSPNSPISQSLVRVDIEQDQARFHNQCSFSTFKSNENVQS